MQWNNISIGIFESWRLFLVFFLVISQAISRVLLGHHTIGQAIWGKQPYFNYYILCVFLIIFIK